MSSPPSGFQEALRAELPNHSAIVAPARSHIIATGPTGTGKSEFCLLLAGVTDDIEREAHVRLFGNSLDKIPPNERARRIALVPSDPFLAFTGIKRTLLGELEMIQRLVKMEGTDGSTFLERVSGQLDLVDHLHRDPFTLSGGEAVRAALAMALVKRPLLVVLDQMHEQLDAEALPRIQESIAALLPRASLVFETRSRGVPATNYNNAPDTRGWHIELRSLDTREAASTHPSAARTCLLLATGQVVGAPLPSMRVEGLKYQYPSTLFSLGPINMQATAGECIAIVGPNGSGKSTLLKCLALLIRPHFERMEILAADGTISTPPTEREAYRWAAHALYCFQRPEDQLYLPTVREELAETSRRLGNGATFDKAMKLAARLGFESHFDRSPYDLPRSFRRLIPLAGALAVGPPLLLLDEPTVGLDDSQVACLIELLNERRGAGATIFVSHDQAFIAASATKRLDIRDLRHHHGQFSSPD